MPETDFEIRRGNNTPVTWEFVDAQGAAQDLAGATFVLTVAWRGALIVKDSSDPGLEVRAETGEVVWTPSLSESRMIPVGRVARYELEWRSGGKQRTWASGTVTGVGGLGGD
jgi:hypothetical protein